MVVTTMGVVEVMLVVVVVVSLLSAPASRWGCGELLPFCMGSVSLSPWLCSMLFWLRDGGLDVRGGRCCTLDTTSNKRWSFVSPFQTQPVFANVYCIHYWFFSPVLSFLVNWEMLRVRVIGRRYRINCDTSLNQTVKLVFLFSPLLSLDMFSVSAGDMWQSFLSTNYLLS